MCIYIDKHICILIVINECVPQFSPTLKNNNSMIREIRAARAPSTGGKGVPVLLEISGLGEATR